MARRWFHVLAANKMRKLTDAYDPWPAFYRCNSRRTLRRIAKDSGFAEVRLVVAGVTYERLVNNSSPVFTGLRSNIFGTLVRLG